jgi:excisionase family DNA binding protein
MRPKTSVHLIHRKQPERRPGVLHPYKGVVVTVREVARKLEISVSLVYRLIESGKLGCTRHGLGRGVIRVSEAQLTDYLALAERGPRPTSPGSMPRGMRLKHIRL